MEVFKDILQKLLDSDRAIVKVHFPQLNSHLIDLTYRIQIKNILSDKKKSAQEKLISIEKIIL